MDDAEWAAQFDWGDLRVTFKDVAGLDDVKRQVNLRIIAPFKQPEVYQAFGRKGGGGILLYGPPGCGKTYLARAVAGELGARFVSVSIHDVLDKYWGESQRLIHALFEQARRNAPTVLFFDEFDALGSTRGREEQQYWKTLVDQLLQEMDGVGGRNRDVLMVAATNVPWNVDSAFRRPGRFDRVLLVTPPDKSARTAMLEQNLRTLPGGEALDVRGAVEKTELYSGADLVELANRTTERALERSLESGQIHRVEPKDLERAIASTRASTLEWLAMARNYARYSNEGGQYDELVEYLKRVKKW
ncbi:MAG: ATP-binding protein [Planctomycetes bacterium]|nr:ATP-binding protein [Planctomycetota bacterium]